VTAAIALGALGAAGACTEGLTIEPGTGDPSTDGSVGEPASDAAKSEDSDLASGDSGSDADAPVDCDGGTVACGGVCVDTQTDSKNCGACEHDCLGAACDDGLCKEELVSPAGTATAVDVTGGVVYWTEQGTNNAVRKCPTTGCATLPAALATPTNPKGIAVPEGANAIFYADNQYGSIVYKMGLDGASPTGWTGTTSNGAGLVASGTEIYWGSTEGLYRTAFAASGATIVMSGNLSGTVENGPHTVAVDDKNVYAAPEGTPLRACPLGTDCSTSGGTVIANEPSVPSHSGVGGIASDGTHVFYTGGKRSSSGVEDQERLVRCPVAGCAAGEPEVLWSRQTTTNTGSHVGITLDEHNVYWGTVYGSIYTTAKNCVAPCTAREIVSDAKPWGMKIDGPYLYWADRRGGIYRVVR
jgi:hypothetical protein